MQLDKGVLLRRSMVSFRSAADEKRIRKEDKTNTPGTSRSEGSKNAGDTEKTKAATKRASLVEEDLRRKKRRVLESSDDETDGEDETEREKQRQTTVEVTESDKQAGETKNLSEVENQASGSKKPAVSEGEGGPKSVGKRRKVSEEATRRSTRARRGVDEMGGVVIQRIEPK